MITAIESDAPAVTWGVGLFETMLVVGRRVPFLADHHTRMSESANRLGFPAPSRENFARVVREAAAAVADEEAGLRCSWLATDPDLDDEGSWRLVARARPLPGTALARRGRGRVIVLESDLVRAVPNHKTTSYLPSILGLRRAMASGADEGLFVDEKGGILEGTMTNIFAIRENLLITPSADRILPGITRQWVIDHAGAAGLDMEIRALTRADLLGGSFMTSSLTRLAPVRAVDGRPAQEPTEAFEMLKREFDEAIGLPP